MHRKLLSHPWLRSFCVARMAVSNHCLSEVRLYRFDKHPAAQTTNCDGRATALLASAFLPDPSASAQKIPHLLLVVRLLVKTLSARAG